MLVSLGVRVRLCTSIGCLNETIIKIPKIASYGIVLFRVLGSKIAILMNLKYVNFVYFKGIFKTP